MRVARPDSIPLARERLAAWLADGHHGSMDWMAETAERRAHPRALWPEVGRWLPGGAASAVLQLGEVATTRGDLLPVWGGALLLVAYAAVLSVVAATVTLRRDLT